MFGEGFEDRWYVEWYLLAKRYWKLRLTDIESEA